ncbi:hypothetical protein JN853_26110 [Pseudomonas syringae pv. actinidiae ICMP 9853]|nr:hypothetical protein JN853_26110 [Pseudomonas syringae pv. actinidiae ICMP 9853]NVL57991.1 hypothetical protein [Pseudomonas syringae pv. actinidiae]
MSLYPDPIRGHAIACGSELAHEEAGANTENLLISQSAFASKLAHKRRVGRSAHIKPSTLERNAREVLGSPLDR